MPEAPESAVKREADREQEMLAVNLQQSTETQYEYDSSNGSVKTTVLVGSLINM